jgi:hypothetical protein
MPTSVSAGLVDPSISPVHRSVQQGRFFRMFLRSRGEPAFVDDAGHEGDYI